MLRWLVLSKQLFQEPGLRFEGDFAEFFIIQQVRLLQDQYSKGRLEEK